MISRKQCGWDSAFVVFHDTPAKLIAKRLGDFVADASPEQERAWADSLPPMQHEVGEILEQDGAAGEYVAILEYELPMESRRPDMLMLINGAVIVIELKGKSHASQADIDQAAGYARDLRCYHRECHDRPVYAVLVPTRARGYQGNECGVHIVGPDAIDKLVADLDRKRLAAPIAAPAFLSYDAYQPLPTLVEAARELMHSGEIRSIHRARAATDPAVEAISQIIHEAAATKTRRLVLLTGIPGAGKTLVGLRIAHAHFLDDLAVERDHGKPVTPAVYLSGNGPLVEVLQYELKSAGGDGKTFVRGVKDYVKRYSRSPSAVPPEHVLIFDEAQRAWDAARVADGHGGGASTALSEPEHFIEFAERIPEWCVVLGLIGGGQEIHTGEEAGIGQWQSAIERSPNAKTWIVHGPPQLRHAFENTAVGLEETSDLNLDQEIRFHLASDLHRYVANVLDAAPAEENAAIAERLADAGYHLRITRELEVGKQYLRDRYAEDPMARYGLIASSKDRDLVRFGVDNDFQSTKRIRFGPWYGDTEDHPDERSCRHLRDCVTEFGAQGLELDAALLAWGTDLVYRDGEWSNANARGYRTRVPLRDPFQLRVNSYRVLLTRSRDAVVVYVPLLPELEATYGYLHDCGFRALDTQ